ncbi:hypothetical protein [Effusibacillus lacus]|uniref:Lipoprotein n=1 Tax=Effusibacillus lacus TaxID=1348429 RepID=A0A292YMZ4_9BACL|nr:hypothetical protein [Effusibacillus lacus]TCS76968.1 hypothetical protein EDD64_101192 [Effusibacillus lacus]GAX91298.1 hypothetical protein EFBL_2964 [Effusibacillus lacus]
MQNKTSRLVGLFAATALTISAGCSSAQPAVVDDDYECTDENNDGYCDQDGTPIDDDDSFIYKNGKKYYKKIKSGVTSGSVSKPSTGSSSSGITSGSSGSSSKGGIGSSGGSSTS